MIRPDVLYHGLLFGYSVWTCSSAARRASFKGPTNPSGTELLDVSQGHYVDKTLNKIRAVLYDLGSYKHAVAVPQNHYGEIVIIENYNRVHVITAQEPSGTTVAAWPSEWENGWTELYQYPNLYHNYLENKFLYGISMPRSGFVPDKDWRPKTYNVRNFAKI